MIRQSPIKILERKFPLALVLLGLILGSCASYEKFRQVTEEFELASQVYPATYDQTWQAVISIMKKFDILERNQALGTIKTRWSDNTKSYNFANVFGSTRDVKSARFQLQLSVAKGFQGGREVSKVTLYKRQLVEQDVLQGFKEMFSDGILEKTILYRIGQLLKIEKHLDEIQKQKEKEQLKSFEN